MPQLTYSGSLSGRVILPKNSRTNVREGTATTERVIWTVEPGNLIGTATGYYKEEKDGSWVQILLPQPKGGMTKGFVRTDVVKMATEAESKQLAQAGDELIQKLVKSDMEVGTVLTRIDNTLKAAEKKGINVSDYRTNWNKLAERFNTRQTSIKNSKVLQYKEKLIVLATYAKAWWLTNSMLFGVSKSRRIGAVPLVAVIVGAVAGVGLSVAAYFILKPKYTESQTDLKISQDLEKALSTLDPQARQAVVNDLESQIDTAYNQGKTDGTFSGMGKILKPILFLGLGAFAVTKIMNHEPQKS